jgi:hypothetical protein
MTITPARGGDISQQRGLVLASPRKIVIYGKLDAGPWQFIQRVSGMDITIATNENLEPVDVGVINDRSFKQYKVVIEKTNQGSTIFDGLSVSRFAACMIGDISFYGHSFEAIHQKTGFYDTTDYYYNFLP